MEDHRSFISEFPYLSLLISKDPFSSHPPLSQLSQMVVSRAFYSKCIGRVHTSRLVAQGGEGREEVTLGVGTLSSTTPCLSQVAVSHLDIPGGFHDLTVLVREIHHLGGRKLMDVSRPTRKLAARPIHPPTHHRLSPYLPPLLEFSLRIQCWCNLENVR